MSIGVYIPSFNVEKYICESVFSIIGQTFEDWELAILDDCSSDETFKKAELISKTDNRISVFKKEEHSGKIGNIKNEAISKFSKSHEYVCHVGSDDKIPEYCFELFVNYMNKNKDVGACCGNFICFNDGGKQWSFPHVSNSGEFDENVLLKYMNLFPMRFYRKSIVDSVGGYDNSLTSAVDYDLALKLSEKTKIHRIKDPITYYYRQHSEQVSTKYRKEQNLNAKIALQNALKRRNINAIIKNDFPPFVIENKEEEHFIWGKK